MMTMMNSYTMKLKITTKLNDINRASFPFIFLVSISINIVEKNKYS